MKVEGIFIWITLIRVICTIIPISDKWSFIVASNRAHLSSACKAFLNGKSNKCTEVQNKAAYAVIHVIIVSSKWKRCP